MLERRVHYRRQNHYRTKSNKYKIVKTPGKLTYLSPYEYVMYLIVVCRWQAHNSLLEEKRRQDHARYPQAQITSSLKTLRHQENSFKSLRWQIGPWRG